MIEHLTTTILHCMTNAPNPEAGARLAAYRVTDELRKAMLSDEPLSAGLTARVQHLGTAMIITAAWDAVMGDDDDE